MHPGFWEGPWGLAYMLAAEGDVEEAVELAAQGAEWSGGHGLAAAVHAMVLAMVDEHERATEILETIISREETHALPRLLAGFGVSGIGRDGPGDRLVHPRLR